MLLTGVSGQYHSWQITSAAIKRHLDEAKIFDVDVVLCPDDKEGKAAFDPVWSDYDVVFMAYDDGNWSLPTEEQSEWSEKTKATFENYVAEGGGLVVQHAANNCFPNWPAFNKMIAVGGWGGRDETSGPAIAWRNDAMEHIHTPGEATHPECHDYQVVIRDSSHPITQGLPEKWMHPHDELYCGLRGPAKDVSILTTAYADPTLENSSGEHEPVLMVINYGKGRVFHTILGHAGANAIEPIAALDCVGFMFTNQRGTEWAATGKVTLTTPNDFPTESATSIRKWTIKD